MYELRHEQFPQMAEYDDSTKDHVKFNFNDSQAPPTALPFLLDYGFRPPLLDDNVWLTPEQASWSFSLPLFGRIRIVKDPFGLLCSMFIIFYWFYNVSCAYYVILLPRYYFGTVSIVLLLIYGLVAALCISSFFRAATLNPGALSSIATPGNDWGLCLKCNSNRPTSTHHCRRCGQCVRKMDHHCPWINNCVGEDNQFLFMLLLLYAYILSLFTLVLDVCFLFDFIPCPSCSEHTVFGISERRLIWISFFMAIFMICSGFSLFMLQQFAILLEVPSMIFNRMQMEFFLTRKLPTAWPGKRRSAISAYRSTCGQSPVICWMFPCRRRRASMDTSFQRERLVSRV